MTKADLKDWMIVEDNRGGRYFVDTVHEVLLEYNAVGSNNVLALQHFTDDLCRIGWKSFYITKVFQPSDSKISYIFDGEYESLDCYLVWERPEQPAVEMTVAEIEEKLGIKNLKIVKENENG